MLSIIDAAKKLQAFEQGVLTDRISVLEKEMNASNLTSCKSKLNSAGIDDSLLVAALTMKRISGQINVIIHALGILLALPKILQRNERVESLSLGAGNSGKDFDVVTNQRVAEFKFIDWKGGPESIRQNSIFKDFFNLAEYETDKERFLYITGIQQPLKFFQGGRALKSVMSLNSKVWKNFQDKYGSRFEKVQNYYKYRKDRVRIVDLNTILPSFLDFSRRGE